MTDRAAFKLVRGLVAVLKGEKAGVLHLCNQLPNNISPDVDKFQLYTAKISHSNRLLPPNCGFGCYSTAVIASL